MVLTAADIVKRLTGGQSNADPAASLGGVPSSVDAGANLFDDVTGRESRAGHTDYRCFIVRNIDGVETAIDVAIFFNSNTTNPADILAIGVGGAVNTNPVTIADDVTPPSGVTFSNPTSGAPLDLPDLDPNQFVAIWIRRTVGAGQGRVENVMANIDVEFDF